ALLLYQSDGLAAHAASLIHVVDDGRPAAGQPWHAQGFPGAQTSIAFTASGKIALAYQDASAVDLVFALYDPAKVRTLSRSTLRSAGASGFWPHLALAGGMAYVESASIKAVTASSTVN